MSARDRMMKTTAVVTAVIFASKAVGFVRDAIQASYFGTGIESDAYTAAYAIFYLPILLFNSCITSTLVPLYVQASREHSLKRANQFASNAVNLFALFAMVASVIMYLLAGPLIQLTAPGYQGEKLALAIKLTRIMMPSLVFVVISIVTSSVLNARERYVAAQLTGFPLSFALIVAMVLFSSQYGIVAVAWGVFFASILQVVILLPPLRGVFRYSFRFRIRDKRFQKMLILSVPSILSMAVNEINHMINNALSSSLPHGSMFSLSLAYRLITLITGVLIVPLTTIMFSKMSLRVTEQGKRGIIDIVKQCMEVLAVVLLPIIVIAAVFNFDIIRLAYMRGKFTVESAKVTGDIFMYYVIGVLAFGYRDFLNRAFHSIQDTRTPMINAFLALALNVVLNFVLRYYMGVNGLALATTISSIVSVGILVYLLRRSVGKMGMKRTVTELLKTGIAAGVCAVICLALNYYVPQAVGMLHIFLRLALCTVVALAVYLGALVLFKVRQLEFLGSLFGK